MGVAARQNSRRLDAGASSESSPLVSIILPVHNREDHVAGCLDSVLAQTYPNIEIVVVDDGSRDRTAVILEGYGHRIRLFRQDNQGPYVARNRALSEAAGTLVAFADSDDRMPPERIERQVRCLQAHPAAVLCYTFIAFRNRTGEGWVPSPARQVAHEGDLSRRLIARFGGNIPWPTAMVWRSAAAEAGPFDTAYRVAMDREWGMRMAQLGEFAVVREPLYDYTLHDAHISRHIEPREAAAAYVLAKIRSGAGLFAPHAADRMLLRQAEGHMHLQLARLAYSHHDRGGAARHAGQAARACPGLLVRTGLAGLMAKIALAGGRRWTRGDTRRWSPQDQSRTAARRHGALPEVEQAESSLAGTVATLGSPAASRSVPGVDPPPGPGARHLIITPVKDEAAHIGALIESMVAQTLPPVRWIIVDDASTDETLAILERARSRAPFVEVRSAHLPGGRALGGRVVELFGLGLAGADLASFEFVTKLDGDLVLPPNYLAALTAQFAADPRLGIAGGACYLREGNREYLEKVPVTHVRGALKTYRRETFEAIGGLEAGLGWDTLDLVRAQMAGWGTRSIPELRVWHRRRTSSVGGLLRGRRRLGHTAWRLGYDPLFLAGRALRVACQERPLLFGGMAMAWGYAVSAFTRCPRIVNANEMRFLRKQQRQRVGRFGRPSGAQPPPGSREPSGAESRHGQDQEQR